MYRAARVVAAFLLTCLSPVTYHHLERAQLDAPYILISNHNSLMDPLRGLEVLSVPDPLFLGKKELVKNPLLRWLFQKLLMIDVDRHNMDMAALRACLKTLREGHPLGVFPEGTRQKEGVMEHMESGIAMIALRSGARLLPAYIAGPGLFRRTHVYYGEPFSVKDIAARMREACREVLERIQEVYLALEQEDAAVKM